MRVLVLLFVLSCSQSDALGVRCSSDPNVPSCYCFNHDSDTNDTKCDATPFKNGHCCATRGWPDDLGSGSCRCDQALCYQYQTGSRSCICGLYETAAPGTMEVASCSSSSTVKCCMRNGNCECNDFTSCSDGVFVASCSPDVIANHCPTDRPLRVDRCTDDESKPPL